jgi:surfeit locus 1 family protein
VAEREPGTPVRRCARALALGAIIAAAFAAFVALGLWQLHRLAWKEALIARVQERANAPAAEAPGPPQWPGVDRDTAEYRRVQVRGRYDHARETLVRASTALGAGHWVLTPLHTEAGWWLWVNRGFVPPEWRERASRRASEPADEVQVTGLLRLSEPGGSLLQANDPAGARWYSRDVAALGLAQGLAGASAPVAPYFVDAFTEATAERAIPDASSAAQMAGTQERWPRPGLTVLHFSNNHRAYAMTWFALAAGAVVALALLRRESILPVEKEPAS